MKSFWDDEIIELMELEAQKKMNIHRTDYIHAKSYCIVFYDNDNYATAKWYARTELDRDVGEISSLMCRFL